MSHSISHSILVGATASSSSRCRTPLEELFYRGYLIEGLRALTARPCLAYAVSWLTFTLVHLRFFGLGATLQVAILSAATVWVYRNQQSQWPRLVVHGINSLLAYVLFPVFG